MSAITSPSPLDIEEQITLIRRGQAETSKFAVEQSKLAEEAGKMTAELHKLVAEREKLTAERDKLAAQQAKMAAEQNKLGAELNKRVSETLKVDRDRWLAPVIAVASVVGAVSASVVAVTMFVRTLRGG